MSMRPLCLLLLLHRPQGTAAFSARVPPVDEDGLGRGAAAQDTGKEVVVGRRLTHGKEVVVGRRLTHDGETLVHPAMWYEQVSYVASCEAYGCATLSTPEECGTALAFFAATPGSVSPRRITPGSKPLCCTRQLLGSWPAAGPARSLWGPSAG